MTLRLRLLPRGGPSVLEYSTVAPGANAPALSPLVSALLRRARLPEFAEQPATVRALLLAAIRVDRTPASLYALADWLSGREEWTEAAMQLELAWERAKWIGSAAWRARCCHALADVYRQLGWLDLSRRQRQWGIAAELDARSTVDLAAWSQDRVHDALLAGEVDRAEAWSILASSLNPHSSRHSPAARLGRGVIDVHLGRWSRGLRCCIEAYHLALRDDEPALAARAVLMVGHILRSREKWRRAISAFRRAGRLFALCGSDLGQQQSREFVRECQRFLNVLTGDIRRN